MTSRRFHVDHETEEILLLQRDRPRDGWVPAIPTMRSWQAGHIRIYNPSDISLPTLISMPGNLHWTILLDNEEPVVIPEHPWIPASHAIDIPRGDIPDADDMYRILASHSDEPYNQRMERYLRPTLFVDMPLRLGQPTFESMLESAITASLSHPPPRQRPLQRPTPLPPHVAAIVLATAEASRQACPISMEPIRKTTGAVTSCGHVFQAAAIQEWLQSNDTCPECRQSCSI